ncbi:MAG TPA: hypothetical protein VL742_00085 [Casimicrobiaceae bacterium]|nr:hypothetical protein [Casimicrobiaceae bacterium]
MLHHGLGYHLVAVLVAIYPSWKIFERAGLNPALSLLIFVPLAGWWIAAAILAFSRWPKLDASISAGPHA